MGSSSRRPLVEGLEGRALMSGSVLAGTAFGTAGSWGNSGNNYSKAVDGSLSTYFDAPAGDGNYVGLDLGTAQRVGGVRYAPRAGYEQRMVGGKIQGSNTSATGGFVDLATITARPAAGVYSTVSVSDATAYRFVRYLAPNGSYGNVAELEFTAPGETTSTPPAATPGQLTGSGFGSAGSWNNSGNTFEKALDGNNSSFFDAPVANGNYVGIDLGAAKAVGSVSFVPRGGFAGRMVGGRFQGSNTSATEGFVDLYTVASQPADGVATTVNVTNPGSHRWVRYVSPSGSYGNVAEVKFFGTTAGAPTVTVPVGPTGLAIRETDRGDGIDLKWVDNAANETGYMVDRSTSADFATYERFFLPGNSTGYADRNGLAGFTAYYYRVSATNSAGRSAFSNTDWGSTADVVWYQTTDNTKAADVQVAGDWATVAGGTGVFGGSYFSDGNTGKGEKSVLFTTDFLEGGHYDVEVWYPAAATNASNVPVYIYDTNGTRLATLDQRTGGGQWVRLAEISVQRGDRGIWGGVEIRNDGTDGTVVADAVRFVRRPYVEVYDDTAGATWGPWERVTSADAYGGSYLKVAPPAGETGAAYDGEYHFQTWSSQGLWRLYVKYAAAPDNASNAFGGVDMRSGDGKWANLGDYYSFFTSQDVYLRVGAAVNGNVTIDAFRWVLVGPQ